jgi:hypothetical protein
MYALLPICSSYLEVRKKYKYIEFKTCDSFSSTDIFRVNFRSDKYTYLASYARNTLRNACLCVSRSLKLSDLNRKPKLLDSSSKPFQYPSSVSRVTSCVEADGWTDRANLLGVP